MAAEEAKDPKRTIPKAYISGILTLVILAMGVMFFAGGVGDWRTLVEHQRPTAPGDENRGGRQLRLGCTCWCGLACSVWWRASTASSSATRVSSSPWPAPVTCRPSWPNCRASRRPTAAIIAGGVVGIAAIYSDGLINLGGMTLTAAMITMAVFGAIVMYIMSMLSLFKLRKDRTTTGTHLPRAGLPHRAGYRAGTGGGVPGSDGLVQCLDRADLPGFYGGGFHLLPDDRTRPRRCARRDAMLTGQ